MCQGPFPVQRWVTPKPGNGVTGRKFGVPSARPNLISSSRLLRLGTERTESKTQVPPNAQKCGQPTSTSRFAWPQCVEKSPAGATARTLAIGTQIPRPVVHRSEEHTSELQSLRHLV